MSQSQPQPPYPIHESVKDLVLPEYAEFYNKYIINLQQTQYQPVEVSRSGGGTLMPGNSEPLKVKSIKDYSFERRETKGPPVEVRVFTPEGEAPKEGWPCLLYQHGGGWVLGNIDSEKPQCTNWASRAGCVVISVNYRLAPEDPFPAAVEDTWESYLWAVDNAETLGINLSKLASGGSSAGGNLTAVLTHLINEKQDTKQYPRLMFQLLMVPVCDNSASAKTYETWDKFENTVALPAVKMMWYRERYLPDEASWVDPRASPIYYPDESFAKCPPAHVAVAGIDVLSGEGIAYADKLKRNGVEVTFKSYQGAPHPIMVMDGVLKVGAELVSDCCNALKTAFQ